VQGSYRSGKTKKLGNLCGQGKVRGKYYFEKSEKMILDHADCICVIFFVFPNIKKQANLWLSLNIQKLEMFRLQGGL